jgi:DNA-binding IclR family transcriptional regulator
MEGMNSQARILEEIKVLYENHAAGLNNKELAELVGTSAMNVCRDLAIIERYKWIARDGRGRWRLSAEFGGIAGQIMKSFKQARLELARDEERYAAAMR